MGDSRPLANQLAERAQQLQQQLQQLQALQALQAHHAPGAQSFDAEPAAHLVQQQLQDQVGRPLQRRLKGLDLNPK